MAYKVFNLPNNGGKLEFAWVPAGTLAMTWREGFWRRIEKSRSVNIKSGFWLGKYPITQRQYQAVMGENPSCCKALHQTKHLDCPVERVSWHDATAFCKALSQILNQTIDLPSETQWEWAARGATQSQGYSYAGSDDLLEVGWFDGNTLNRATSPVGQKKPNELGLYDMSGNVWEWCKDNWSDNRHALPQDGTPLSDGGESKHRTRRGCSWFNGNYSGG